MLPTLCKLNQASPRAEILGVLKEKGTEFACPNRSEEIAQDEREREAQHRKIQKWERQEYSDFSRIRRPQVSVVYSILL